MNQKNLKIVLDNVHHLDYTNAESLGIKINRITEDYNDASKRFTDYTYTVSFPKTKNNQTVFEYPDTKGRSKIFIGKEFGAKVFLNNQLLINGVIELLGYDNSVYKCQITSKFTDLSENLKGKKLTDLQFDPVVWRYGKSVADHINGSVNVSPHLEFPLSFYQTFFVSGMTGTTRIGTIGEDVTKELQLGVLRNYDLTYSAHTDQYQGINPQYYTSFPPSVYLTSIVNQLIVDAGWTLSGSFFERDDIRKIIVPFTGKGENIDKAVTTGSTNYLNIQKILPETDQTEFLKGVVTAFNLYFFINYDQKIITFETYNSLFLNNNPYDITNKVDKDTIEVTKPNAETKITFDDDKKNTLIHGYGRIIDYNNLTERNPTYFLNPNKWVRYKALDIQIGSNYDLDAFNTVYNKLEGDKEVKLKFAPTNYYPLAIINSRSIQDYIPISSYIHYWTVGIPLLSDQTPFDNKDHPFTSDKDTGYVEGNNSNRWGYDGGLKLAYYYGQACYNYKLNTSFTRVPYSDFCWVGVVTGSSTNFNVSVNLPYKKVKVPIASPYQLLNTAEANSLKTTIASYKNTQDATNEKGATAHNLLTTFYSVGTTGDTHTSTNFSLTFGDNEDSSHENIYTYFHKNKYELLRNGSLMNASMFMNENDWREMQIYRSIIYDKEYYQIVSIKNYNPINNTADITLLKKTI